MVLLFFEVFLSKIYTFLHALKPIFETLFSLHFETVVFFDKVDS